MTIHEGVPVPCAYLISSALEVKNYLQFMRVSKRTKKDEINILIGITTYD